jgi:uncharacterized heparinase superfamily protein
MNALRLMRTVRHLSAEQAVHQVRRRIERFVERPEKFARRPIGPFPGCRWPKAIDFLEPGPQRNERTQVLAGRLQFLNETLDAGWPPDWDAGPSRLWAYNLHYFDYLWALDYAEAKRAAADWIARHGLGRGRVGWEPYPTSLRLMNWCGCFWSRHRERLDADPAFRDSLWNSVAVQADWLAGHLEHHLRGNHLLENGAALAFAGSCFAGEEAAAWESAGLDLLRHELPEQILEDGGHFERAPMYQARIVYVLRLLAATRGPAEHMVADALGRATRALAALVHPDGEIALFNDSAIGIANDPASLLIGVPATAAGGWSLPATGYFGWRTADGTYLAFDAGPVGPDYLPGHAHGDIFSFELSLAGRRAIVDSGVHDYLEGDMRRYCRSTRAHNTVEIDGQDQCEFWGAFRVARRGRPREVAWRLMPDRRGFTVSGWHDGYERLPGRPRHARRLVWHADGAAHVLMVRDRVQAAGTHSVRSRLHLAPDLEIEPISKDVAVVRGAGLTFRIAFAGPGRLGIEEAFYCPEFGRSIPTRAVVFSADGVSAWESGFAIAAADGPLSLSLQRGAALNGRTYGW